MNQDEVGVLAWVQTWIRAGFDASEEMPAIDKPTGPFATATGRASPIVA